jgi:predicted transcriptional regulator
MSTFFGKINPTVTETVDTKALILEQICKTPGIRYRELLRLAGLSNGTLEYHLRILERTQKVTACRRDGRRAKYYPINISTDEVHILGCVRNKVSRQIVVFILEHDLCSFSEILEHIKKAPSTLSWHLKRLSDAGIKSVIYGQEFQLYKVLNNKPTIEVLHKYRESFEDKIANRYYEMFGEV